MRQGFGDVDMRHAWFTSSECVFFWSKLVEMAGIKQQKKLWIWGMKNVEWPL
jgi:hypothetical protein